MHPLLQQAIENHGVASAEFYEEVAAIGNTPLSEDAGETYHRMTHLTVQRGSASSTAWVLASTREKANLNMSRDFIRSAGDRSEAVFNFEWRNYKRCMRPSLKNQWIPIRMIASDFYAKLYGLTGDEENCSELLGFGKQRIESTVSAADGQIQAEYAEHVLKRDFPPFPSCLIQSDLPSF